VCRICLAESRSNVDELIAPCLCKGGQKWVHRSCLNRWRSQEVSHSFSRCPTCHFTYKTRNTLSFLQHSHKSCIFYLLVIRDILLALGLIFAVVVGLSLVFSLVDPAQSRAMSHYFPEFTQGCPTMWLVCILPLYVVIAIAFILLGIGVAGVVINCAKYPAMCLWGGMYIFGIFIEIHSRLYLAAFCATVGLIAAFRSVLTSVMYILQKHTETYINDEDPEMIEILDLSDSHPC